ncbi:uncharacterized protein RCO7_08978 [Rhynchosporium graminicola]|uniref:Uncharacterized protein n=1 Tax=Rhynchosporium graminicola TaxID=2792576 RepID=A0A1E1JYW1_9HELO|nr:uncharacterized protein RCO7_08978 [Rhynchosporium commune]
MWSYVRRSLNPANPQVTATTADLAAPLPLVMEGETPPAIAVQSPGVFADRPSDSSTKTVTSNRTALDLSTDSDDTSSDPVATIAAAAELTPVSVPEAAIEDLTQDQADLTRLPADSSKIAVLLPPFFDH